MFVNWSIISDRSWLNDVFNEFWNSCRTVWSTLLKMLLLSGLAEQEQLYAPLTDGNAVPGWRENSAWKLKLSCQLLLMPSGSLSSLSNETFKEIGKCKTKLKGHFIMRMITTAYLEPIGPKKQACVSLLSIQVTGILNFLDFFYVDDNKICASSLWR